jgi:hypothetical protein
MTTAPQVLPIDTDPAPATPPARITFRQPISTSGFIDAAWWPYSTDLTVELPALLDVMWSAAREINRVTFSIGAWEPAPRRMQVQGRTVRLGGFKTSDPITIRLSDAWGRERVDILVIAPTTDPEVAERALELTGRSGSPHRAAELLSRAAQPATGAGSA